MITTIDCDYVGPGIAAAYLRVAGTEAAFIEANTTHAVPKLLAALAKAGRSVNEVKYVVLTHAHLDHAGGASALMAACPQATLLCHPRAARNLIDPTKLIASAIRVYGEERFQALYGAINPIPAARVRELADGESFMVGVDRFTVHYTAGHAKHHFVVHDEVMSAVFTGDAFGLVYPHLQRAGRIAFPSTTPIDFDAAEAHASVDRIVGLKAHSVFPTHFGEWHDQAVIADQLHRWLDYCQRGIDDCIREGRSHPEAYLRDWLAKEMTRVLAPLNPTAEDQRLIEFDLTLNAQGLAFVANRALTS
jgi:glyoxylase-like metal-dependent hydrolase (beta-lactamase superfamily II)